jgi:hypothetical protein
MGLVSRLALIAAIAAMGGLVAPPPAVASISQPTVVSPDPANFTPNVKDDGVSHSAVYALAQSGTTMYAGGLFQKVTNAAGTATYTRTNIMSFSASTGAMTKFAPNVNGQVWAIEPSADGSSLYIGGTFTSVKGVERHGIAKIDATTGDVDTAFNAKLASGRVTQIRLVNGRLIIGGTFPKRLAALDPATGGDTGYINLSIKGSVASNAGPTEVYRFDVSPDGSRLVAVGNFTSVAGKTRYRAFMADLGAASATVASWYYEPLKNMCRAESIPDYLRDVDFSPDSSYFVIVSTGWIPVKGGLWRDVCDAAARFETKTANPSEPTWMNYTGGDTLHSVVATGSVVYIQGHQRWVDNPYGVDEAGPGAVKRQGIAALDPVSGKALEDWNPSKTRAVGGKDLLATEAGLWVASDGQKFRGEYRDNIAFCPL